MSVIEREATEIAVTLGFNRGPGLERAVRQEIARLESRPFDDEDVLFMWTGLVGAGARVGTAKWNRVQILAAIEIILSASTLYGTFDDKAIPFRLVGRAVDFMRDRRTSAAIESGFALAHSRKARAAA
jgi:hypothetical protein